MPTIPTRVLIIGLDYAPDSFGIAPYTTGLAENFVESGSEVDVICGMPYYPEWRVRQSHAGKLTATETRNGVTLRRCRQYVPSRQSSLRRVAYETSFLASAGYASRGKRSDIVFGITPSLGGGFLAARLAKRWRVPFILIVQDLLGQAARQSGIRGGSNIAGLTARIETSVASSASAVCVVSEGFRTQLSASGVDAKRIHLVRNWVHIKSPDRDKATIRRQLGLPLASKIILHSGNMGLKQGLSNIVDTARLASTSHPDYLFVLMGSGSQRAELELAAQGLPNFRFIDPQSDTNFPSVLASADVLLLNQRASVVDMSFPSKLTSYLASGRPVIAAVASTSEAAVAIKSNNLGIVIEPENPQALLKSIDDVLTNQTRALELGQRGAEYARANLTAEASLGRMHAIVDKVLSERRQRNTEGRETVSI